MPSVRRAAPSGPRTPGCSSGAVSTSSPGPQAEAREDAHHALAGGGGQRDVGRVGAERDGVAPAQVLACAATSSSKYALPRPCSADARALSAPDRSDWAGSGPHVPALR